MISQADFNEIVKITVEDGAVLTGRLTVPRDAKAIIIFAHGSGSSHLSPRNNFVAEVLQQEKFATLLVDLLTPEESEDEANNYNVEKLTRRLVTLREWADQNPYTEALFIGLLGSTTGVAAALHAAAKSDGKISSLVSRGGRPDLAMDVLPQVRIPVLFLVGSNDHEIIKSNQKALTKLPGDSEMRIIEGAGHLFEEPGKLEEAAQEAKEWFLKTI